MFKPNFTITQSILKDISEITECKAIIERSRVLPLNEAQLRRQAIVRMAHTSTSIEGNRLAEYQVDRLISGKEVNADQKSILEVKNYHQALQVMERLVSANKNLTIDLILEIHGLLMKDLLEQEKSGHFRPGPIFIVDDLGDGREKLRFEGPPASKVAFLLSELIKWVSVASESFHPIVLAGIFHTQFVHIHPFADGNGRITRILTTFLLYRLGWDFRKIIVLENYYNRDRQAYYNGLQAGWSTKYQENCDLTAWLEYFSKGFVIEAKKVVESLQSIGFGTVSSASDQVFLDKDEIKIIDFLIATGRLVSADVEDVLTVAKRTAQLKLKNLVEKGIIEVKGRGPSTYYLLAR